MDEVMEDVTVFEDFSFWESLAREMAKQIMIKNIFRFFKTTYFFST